MHTKLRSVLGAALVVATGLVRAEDYFIKLSPPAEVGLKCEVTARGTESEERTLIVGSQTNRTRRTVSAELTAQAEVLEVDSAGHIVKASYTVEKFAVKADNKAESLLPGTTILASGISGKVTFSTKNNSPLSDTIQKALPLVISVHTGGADDDAIFGTAERRKVGDSWPVHADVVAKDLQRKQINVSPGDVKGTVRLVRVGSVNGVNCLHVTAEAQLKGMPAQFPPAFKATSGDVKLAFTGDFPLDHSTPRVAETGDMTLSLKLTGKFGPNQLDGVAEQTSVRKLEARYNYSGQ